MSGSRPWRQQQRPRITSDEVRFSEFAGVVNTRSRKDIGMKALWAGTNVFISDTKKVTRRAGYTAYRATGTVQAAYGETGNLYVVDNGSLLRLATQTDVRTLTTGLANKPYCWDDSNGDVYFVNGVDAGIARGDAYLPLRLTVPTISAITILSAATAPTTPSNMGATYTTATFRILATFITADGRETAPSEIVPVTGAPLTNLIRVTLSTGYVKTNIYCTEADGTVYRLVASTTGSIVTFNPQRGGEIYSTVNTQSLPVGVTHIAICKGRMFTAQYLPALRMSAIWISQPFAFHLWNQAKDMLPISGEVALLLWNNAGVLIGTTEHIYQYDEKTEEIVQLADYGVVPGVAGDLDAQNLAFFWTQRGICKAMPFENMTEQNVSMPPGLRAVGAVVYINGVQQFITVAQGGGEAFNQRKERT